jgi:hypothetical protein
MYDKLLKTASLFLKLSQEELWGGSYRMLKEDEEDEPMDYYSGTSETIPLTEDEVAKELERVSHKNDLQYARGYFANLLSDNDLDPMYFKFLINQGSKSDELLTRALLTVISRKADEIILDDDIKWVAEKFVTQAMSHNSEEIANLANTVLYIMKEQNREVFSE